jgi:hypothetical protein
MRVTRGEAALRFPDQTRLHVYGYVILFGRNDSLTANAATVQETTAGFRNTVEAILKTFKLGPLDGK